MQPSSNIVADTICRTAELGLAMTNTAHNETMDGFQGYATAADEALPHATRVMDANGRKVPKDVLKLQAKWRVGEELSVVDRTWVHPGVEYVYKYPFIYGRRTRGLRGWLDSPPKGCTCTQLRISFGIYDEWCPKETCT